MKKFKSVTFRTIIKGGYDWGEQEVKITIDNVPTYNPLGHEVIGSYLKRYLEQRTGLKVIEVL